jgi:hypothetical protein
VPPQPKHSPPLRENLLLAKHDATDAELWAALEALDHSTERLVQETQENLRSDRTCFVIAHRLSTVQKARTKSFYRKAVLTPAFVRRLFQTILDLPINFIYHPTSPPRHPLHPHGNTPQTPQ